MSARNACGWGKRCCGGDPRGCQQPDRTSEYFTGIVHGIVLLVALLGGVIAVATWRGPQVPACDARCEVGHG